MVPLNDYIPVLFLHAFLLVTQACADSRWGAAISERDVISGRGHECKQDWMNHGGDLHSRRFAELETKISPKTVRNLQLK
ncbi:hypothetical protein SLE2022_278920 [Rubroshorea leprosula]